MHKESGPENVKGETSRSGAKRIVHKFEILDIIIYHFGVLYLECMPSNIVLCADCEHIRLCSGCFQLFVGKIICLYVVPGVDLTISLLTLGRSSTNVCSSFDLCK